MQYALTIYVEMFKYTAADFMWSALDSFSCYANANPTVGQVGSNILHFLLGERQATARKGH